MTALPDSSQSLAHHVSRLLPLSDAKRQSYLRPLDPELATDLLELLAFESTAIDLSQAAGVTLARELMQRTPPETLGPWRVARALGHGGMGSVYLAERENLGVIQQAAAKLGYVQAASDATLAAIQREAKALSLLQHPNIASLLDYGLADDGVPYVVSEFVDGDLLLDYAEKGAFTRVERLRLFVQLLEAIAFAHSRLVLHLDIKPQNVLVTSAGAVKLIDFGLSGIMGAGGSSGETGVATGYTQAYASPEQRAGAPVTVRSDIYSLGLLLHEMVFGCLPGDPRIAAFTRHDTELLAVINHATENDPDLRYPSAIEFKRDVVAVMQHEPVSPMQHQRLYRWRKFIRRNWLPVALAASTATALAVGLFGIGLQYRATVQERDRALALLESEKATSLFITRSLRTASLFGGGNVDTTVGDMLKHMVSTLPDAEKMSDRAIAWLASDLAAVLTGLGEMELALEACDLAVTHAAASDEIEDDIAHWTQYALTAGQAHQYDVALDAAERARVLAEPINHWRLPWTHLARMQTLIKMKRWRDVEALWPIVAAIPTERRSVSGNIDYMRGAARIHLGNFAGAEVDLKRARLLYAELYGDRSVPVADTVLRQHERLRLAGDLDQAKRLEAELQSLFKDAYGLGHYRRAVLTGEVALLRYHQDDAAAAVDGLSQALGELISQQQPPTLLMGYYGVQLARVQAARGELQKALSVLDTASSHLERLAPSHPDRIDATISRAEIHLLNNQLAPSAALFEHAASLIGDERDNAALTFRINRGLGLVASANGDEEACESHAAVTTRVRKSFHVPALNLTNDADPQRLICKMQVAQEN